MDREWKVRTQAEVCPVFTLLPLPILFTCLNSLKGNLCVRQGAGGVEKGTASAIPPSWGLQTDKREQKGHKTFTIGPSNVLGYRTDMSFKLWLILSMWLLLPVSEAGRQMPKLSEKKLCADSECSRKYHTYQLLAVCDGCS